MCKGEQLSIHTAKVRPKKRIKKRKTRKCKEDRYWGGWCMCMCIGVDEMSG